MVPVCLLILMMKMMMKSDAASAEIITAHSGEAVLLKSDLPGLKPRQDVRWTHFHLVMSLENKVTTCHHGRCELLSDGSLRFSRVQIADAGNYSLEMFDENGRRLIKRDFLLRVEGDSSSSGSMVVSTLVCCFLVFLLLLFITTFILKRRRSSQRISTTGQVEENVYVAMHSHHGNQRKDEEKQESHYVPCYPVARETPITEQMAVAVEDIYV
ncbi:uncharacterized protein LOC119500911 isoform X2 [Sebastes umbrosus]|uniref:uncharacterized protein LOC119500911 isoform X2 n=1 Tax=Sebastes umbrosus TaxID=72105 RepID=UPI00189D8FC1|nr:uncharacterized protein LOC119500911 isoform X2 [Sebastes umbrosus]